MDTRSPSLDAQPLSPVGSGTIEAEYFVAMPSRRREAAPLRVPASQNPSGVELLGKAPPRERIPPFSRRGGVGFWTGGLALVALSFWVAGGHALVRGRSGGAEREGLTVAMLESGIRTGASGSFLLVEAEVANGSGEARAVPPVAASIVGEDGRPPRRAVIAAGSIVGANGRQRIVSRLPVPSSGVRSVSVAFSP